MQDELLDFLYAKSLELKAVNEDFRNGNMNFTMYLTRSTEIVDKMIEAHEASNLRKQDERMAQEINK